MENVGKLRLNTWYKKDAKFRLFWNWRGWEVVSEAA
jgi:hypothetical protein